MILSHRLIGFALMVVGLVSAGMITGYQWRDRGARADLAECQRVHAEALAITLRAAQQAETEYRAKESAWEARKQEIVHEAQSDLAAARADADRVRAALDRLRHAKAAAAASSGAAAAHPQAPAGSAPAGAAVPLPADMLIRLGEAAGELARFADESRAAGLACMRSYDSVTTPRL